MMNGFGKTEAYKKTMKGFSETEAYKKNDEGLRRNRSLRKLNNKKKPKTAIQKARLRFRFLFGNQHEGIFTIEIGR